jgi:hypothetical protein
MKLIDALVARAQDLGARRVEVPELRQPDGTAYAIFVSPMTIIEQRELSRRYKDDPHSYLVGALIMKARDEKGEPVFTLEDKDTLMRRCPASLVQWMAAEISRSATVEEQEKN